MPFRLKLHDFYGSILVRHPLLEKLRFDMSAEDEFGREIELSRDQEVAFPFFGVDLGLQFHR